MRKLAPASVSYQDDVLISYHVNMMMGHFISQRFEGTLHVDKYTFDSKSQTLHMRYLFQSTGRPISHRNGWSFDVYMIPVARFRTGVEISPR